MAQLSYRTGSLNSFLGSSSLPPNNVSLEGNNPNKIDKIKRQSSLQLFMGSPVAHRASEDHIHRIRSVITRGDFKQNFKIQTPAECPSKPSLNVKESSDSDDDDVESVDWTAPLDITAILYKPEYIIHPGVKTDKEESESVRRANEKKDLVEDKSPFKTEGRATSTGSMKEELLKNYISKSRRGNRKEQYKREIHDYAAFVKEVNEEIREVSQETKRLEMQSPRGIHRKQENRDVILQRGYTTLKQMYQLNSGLTETAVAKNASGPPGIHWMGLSRINVLEIMQRIRQECNGPEQNSDVSNGGSTTTLTSDKKGQNKAGKRGKNKQKKPPVAKARGGTTQTPKLKKASVVPLQHIPGPKHLHTNICIRPWEPTLDGWSPSANDNNIVCTERETGYAPVPETDCKYDIPPNSPRQLKMPLPSNTTSSENVVTSSTYHHSVPVQENDSLTLEIFNPVYKASR